MYRYRLLMMTMKMMMVTMVTNMMMMMMMMTMMIRLAREMKIFRVDTLLKNIVEEGFNAACQVYFS